MSRAWRRRESSAGRKARAHRHARKHREDIPPAQHPPVTPHAPRHVTCTTPSRRLCVHRSALAPTCRPDVRVPTCRHPRVHPETFCVAQLRHFARSDYNSMDEWGRVCAMRGSDTDGSERSRVSDACHPSTCYPATLHIEASVRAPCPTCSQPPCLVRMLNEPFTQTIGLQQHG